VDLQLRILFGDFNWGFYIGILTGYFKWGFKMGIFGVCKGVCLEILLTILKLGFSKGILNGDFKLLNGDLK